MFHVQYFFGVLGLWLHVLPSYFSFLFCLSIYPACTASLHLSAFFPWKFLEFHKQVHVICLCIGRGGRGAHCIFIVCYRRVDCMIHMKAVGLSLIHWPHDARFLTPCLGPCIPPRYRNINSEFLCIEEDLHGNCIWVSKIKCTNYVQEKNATTRIL
jgi:hypothetical protein